MSNDSGRGRKALDTALSAGTLVAPEVTIPAKAGLAVYDHVTEKRLGNPDGILYEHRVVGGREYRRPVSVDGKDPAKPPEPEPVCSCRSGPLMFVDHHRCPAHHAED
jgi:hypothetical protein